MKIVLDASAALAAVRGQSHATAIIEAIHSASVVIAPDLYVSEVSNALWKYVVAGEIDVDHAVEDLDACLGLIDRFVPVATIAHEAVREAAVFRHPVYDLTYAITARREGCAVVTVDTRLRKLLGAMKLSSVRV